MISFPPSAIGTAIRMVPVVLIVVLMSPAWLTWPFLSEKRRQSVLQMVRILARWAIGDSIDDHDEDDQIEEQHALAASPDWVPLDSDSCAVIIEGSDELG
jgi:hypothetical protein